jgi:DNA-binding NarL/FixJ family response regulator
VDDHAVVRAGFREMLADTTDLHIQFESASGEEALQHLREMDCQVLLLDISLPGISGVDVLRTVRERHPQVKVLVLSGYPEDRYALAMIRNGAAGYLCKDCEAGELIDAIRRVARGKRYLSQRTSELLADELTGEAQPDPHTELSEREFQVFIRLAAGATVSQIADDLHLSIKTISTYRSRLLSKLHVDSNAGLASYAIHHGLLQ